MTLDQHRDQAERDIAKLLRRLNKEHRARVVAAIDRFGSVGAIPQEFWEEIKREADGEIAAILVLLMVTSYDSMTRRVASVAPVSSPLPQVSENDTRKAAAGRAAQLGREAASAHIEYTKKRLETAERNAETREELEKEVVDIMRTKPKPGERDAAETTGITTATRGISAGERAGANDEGRRRGVQIDVKWVTERDGRVCPICAPLHGKPSIEWVDRFPVGPPAHPNCRCQLEPYFKSELPYSPLPGEQN